MEIHHNLYFKHLDTKIHDLLDSLFNNNGKQQHFVKISQKINPKDGATLAKALVDQMHNFQQDLEPESLTHFAGFSIIHFIHPIDGREYIAAILKFLKGLTPAIQVQAWSCMDDNSQEFWWKFEDHALVVKAVSPYISDAADQQIKETIYTWWHSQMPNAIQEGFLNEKP